MALSVRFLLVNALSRIVDQETEAYKQLAKLKSRDGKPLAQSTTPRASSTPSLVSQRGPCISAEIVRRLLELEEEYAMMRKTMLMWA